MQGTPSQDMRGVPNTHTSKHKQCTRVYFSQYGWPCLYGIWSTADRCSALRLPSSPHTLTLFPSATPPHPHTLPFSYSSTSSHPHSSPQLLLHTFTLFPSATPPHPHTLTLFPVATIHVVPILAQSPASTPSPPPPPHLAPQATHGTGDTLGAGEGHSFPHTSTEAVKRLTANLTPNQLPEQNRNGVNNTNMI